MMIRGAFTSPSNFFGFFLWQAHSYATNDMNIHINITAHYVLQ